MAHQLVPIYQLAAAVGKGAPNRGDDVRLIEALIDVSVRGYGRPMWEAQARAKNTKVPAKDIAISGVYSTTLQEWIDFLQMMFKQYKLSRSLDGRVDPLPPDHSSSIDVLTRTEGGSQYLLLQLNTLALNFGGPDEFMTIRQRAGLKFQCIIGSKAIEF